MEKTLRAKGDWYTNLVLLSCLWSAGRGKRLSCSCECDWQKARYSPVELSPSGCAHPEGVNQLPWSLLSSPTA